MPKTTIRKVETWTAHLPLTRPYTITYKTVESVENVFVRLESEDGLIGLGAGSPAPYVTGETIESCQNALNTHLQPILEGGDLRQLRQHCMALEAPFADTPAAQTAIDLALYDLYARYLGLPVAEMLGAVHQSLPTSITIGIKETLAETLEEAEEYQGRGFRIIKLKIGKDLPQDLETVRRLFEKVGSTMKIRVDANQGYSAKELQTFYQQTKHLGLDLIEQPVPQNEPQQMLEVDTEIRRICAGDESVLRPVHALKLAADPQPFGIFNIKLMKCGGIYPALQIAEIARLSGIDLMWGCMDESIISIAGALHAAFACPATRYIDLDGSLDLARDLVKGGFVLEDGMMRIGAGDGLGVTLI